MLLFRRATLVRCALLASLSLPAATGFAAPPKTWKVRPASAMQSSLPKYAGEYFQFFQRASNATEKNLPEITRVAEIAADRYIAGGIFTWPWNGQSLQQEMTGRAGGLLHFGPDRDWKGRTPEQNANNIILTSWDRDPAPAELDQLKKLKETGGYLIGFGPRSLPALADYVPLFDVWFDTGLGADDRVVTLPGGAKAGHGNVLANMLNGWTFEAEFIAALTRKGKMPPMYQSYMVPEARDWAAKYKDTQFHDDLTVKPIAAGELGRAFLQQIRDNVSRFDHKQSANVNKAVSMIVDESKAGRKTVIAAMGHSPYTYLGKGEETAWALSFGVEGGTPNPAGNYEKNTADGALVLRIGYTGYRPGEADLFKFKKQRVILVSTQNPDADSQIPADLPLYLDMEWAYGDACTPIEGYPIKVFPPSGIMQNLVFEAINTEVLAALAAK